MGVQSDEGVPLKIYNPLFWLPCIFALSSCNIQREAVEAKPLAELRGNILTYDIIISNNSGTELVIREDCNLRATTVTDGSPTSLIYDEILEGSPPNCAYGPGKILEIPAKSNASLGRVKVRLKSEVLNDPTVIGLSFRIQAEFLSGPESTKLQTTEYDIAPEYSLMPLVFTRTWEELRR